MNRSGILEKIKDIEGFLSDDEAYALYTLARSCSGKGKIVEIGSWKGKSTICLGHGSMAGNAVTIYAVDPHIGSQEHQKGAPVWTFDEFKKNIQKAGLDQVVVALVKASEEASREFHESIEMLFIDGAHDYDSVKRDFELWTPKVIDGGYVVMHDVSDDWEGPWRVAREMIYESGKFKNVRTIDTLIYAVKTGRNSVLDRVLYRMYVVMNEKRKVMKESFSKKLLLIMWRTVKRIINSK